MLLADKHIQVKESIFGLAGLLLPILIDSPTVEEVWLEVRRWRTSGGLPPIYQSLDNTLLSLTFLFSIGAVTLGGDGRLHLCA